jgi:hypothetical protein
MENEVNELEFDRESETNISVLEGMHASCVINRRLMFARIVFERHKRRKRKMCSLSLSAAPYWWDTLSGVWE